MKSILEIWRDVVGYEGLYIVSNLGKIKRIGDSESIGMYGQLIVRHRNQILKPDIVYGGYCRVTLSKDGIRKRYFVHRLVAETFIPNPENKPEIDHINTITNDNRVENLRWVTRSENQKNPLTVIKKSNSRTGYKNSEETRQKMKDVWYQTHIPKPLSKETKDKISKSHKKKIIQISNNNDYIKIWDSAIDIERELGYWHTEIANVCNGRRKTAYGYIWKYA